MTQLLNCGFESGYANEIGYSNLGAANTTYKRTGNYGLQMSAGQMCEAFFTPSSELYIQFALYMEGQDVTQTGTFSGGRVPLHLGVFR
jgi:hypothetical protein